MGIDPLIALNVFMVAGALYLAYMIARHGLPWVWGKIVAIVSTVKDDAAAASKFFNIQNDIKIIQADIQALKSKVGL